MRAAAPIDIAVKSSTGWGAAVVALSMFGVAGIGAWALAGRGHFDWIWVSVAVVASGVIAIGALRAVPAAASRLRWDGTTWRLCGVPADDGRDLGEAGTLEVALDLGHWMLLRFTPGTHAGTSAGAGAPAAWRCRVTWLGLQRGSDPTQWHPLRCAVFARGREPKAP